MSDLLTAYAAHGPGHDEMLQATGDTRAAWQQVVDHARLDTPEQLAAYDRRVARELHARGLVGPDAPPWPLDALPVVIGQAEWDSLARATAQRLHLLDALLADLYGPRRLLGSGGLPPELVIGAPGFIREVDQLALPSARQLVSAGVDVARNADGSWVALTDRTDAVPGLGLAMENRRIVAEVLADSYRAVRVQRLGPFFRELRRHLELDGECAVLLSVGPSGPRAFDDAALAELLGVPLVQAEDLVVSGARLWLQTLERRERVDVVLRAVRGAGCDPLELRPGSGVPGLVHAARQGGVHIVNPMGSAVLENPALLTHLPRLARTVLGEELLLPSAATYWCGDRAMGSHVIANLGRLVVKSTLPGQGAVRGWELTIDERAELSTRIAAQPWAWVGQEPVRASTSPTTDVGRLSPAPTVLRLFGASGDGEYRILPGGLGRVLPAEDEQVTALPTEGTAKDIWVVTGSEMAEPSTPHLSVRGMLSPRTASGLARLGWHAEHASAVLHLQEAASAGDPAATVAERLLEATHPVADDVAHLLTSARQARGELPAGTWLALARLDGAVSEDSNDPAATRVALAALDAALDAVTGARRHIIAAARDLARAEGAVRATRTVRPEDLSTLLELMTAPAAPADQRRADQHAADQHAADQHAADQRAAARLLWAEQSPVSLRRHLRALRADVAELPVLVASRVPGLLTDVEDLLDELADHPGPVDLTDHLHAAQWRLEEVRRLALTPVPLRTAGLPGERWAT